MAPSAVRQPRIVDPASGGGSVLGRRDELLGCLDRHIPAETVRRREWALCHDGRIYATFCLRGRLSADRLLAIGTKAHMPPSILREAGEFLALGCWRHMIRLDSGGGIGLYCERDWDYPLLRRLAEHFSGTPQIAEVADRLVSLGEFTIACTGMHWNDGLRRFRIYAVAKPNSLSWVTFAERIYALISQGVAPSCDMRLIESVLSRRRRAIMLNIAIANRGLTCKLELPDFRWQDVSALEANYTVRSPCHLLPHPRPHRLSYLGVRFETGRQPAFDYYFQGSTQRG